MLAMQVYWREVRKGQRLVLELEDGVEQEVGGVRATKRGFDAFAQTFGYDPGRAQKGIGSMEEAKAFVEQFRPWELHGAMGVMVDEEVRPQAQPS